MSLIETWEKILGTQVTQRIDFLVAIYGISCLVYKVKVNVFSNVYGKEAGEELSSPIPMTLLVTNDSLTPVDRNSAGTFTEGFVYTNRTDINVGDRLEVMRADGRSRRYKFDAIIALGTTTSVMKKYKIVSLGD